MNSASLIVLLLAACLATISALPGQIDAEVRSTDGSDESQLDVQINAGGEDREEGEEGER
jgi:hypothetical protein